MRPPETWLGNITKAAEIVKVALCQRHQRGGCGIEMSEPGGAGNTDRALTHRSDTTEQEG